MDPSTGASRYQAMTRPRPTCSTIGDFASWWLLERLDLRSVNDVLALCAEIFPEEAVPDRARLVLEDALGPDR